MEMNVMGDILHLLLQDIVNKATLLLHHQFEYVEGMWVLITYLQRSGLVWHVSIIIAPRHMASLHMYQHVLPVKVLRLPSDTPKPTLAMM